MCGGHDSPDHADVYEAVQADAGPYAVVKTLRLQRGFTTIMSAVEAYEHVVAQDAGRYNVVTARKKEP